MVLCAFSPVPRWSQLTNLVSLDLRGNSLTGPIPGSLGSLPKPNTLDFSNNQLSGSIPGSFSELNSLTGLSFGNNPEMCATVGADGTVAIIKPTTYYGPCDKNSKPLPGSLPPGALPAPFWPAALVLSEPVTRS